MDRQSMENVIIARMGNREDLRPHIQIEMPVAQTTMERHWQGFARPWFLARDVELAFSMSDAVEALPADFLGVVEWANAALYLADDKTLVGIARKVSLTDLQTTPEWDGPRYAIGNGVAWLLPVDDTANRLLAIPYYAAEPLLTSATATNQWSIYAPELLISETGARVAAYIRDNETAAMFAQAASGLKASLDEETMTRQSDGQVMQITRAF